MGAPWEEHVTLGDVLDIYAECMKLGGTPSAPKPGCLEQCIGNAWTAECYSQDEDAEPCGLLFAGYLMSYLVWDHCFTDGNKRLAWFLMTWVLDRKGLSVEATDQEAFDFVVWVIERHPSIGEVVEWVADRLIESPDS